MIKEKYFLAFLFIILFAVNYPFLDEITKNFLENNEEVYVSRIIDGDTIIGNNESKASWNKHSRKRRKIL